MAIFLISAVVLAIIGTIAFILTRKPFTPPEWMLYWVNMFYVKVMWRTSLPDRLPVAGNRGAIVICNHRSSIDPCFIQAVAGRRIVHWMVAQLYSQKSLVGYMMKLYRVIPVNRSGRDTGATKKAIRLAREGELVGMLPEGTINVSDEFMRPVRPGAILVAIKAQVPVIPCYLEGAPFHETLWRPALMTARATLKVGKPIDLSAYYGREGEPGLIQQVTIDCVREIAKLAGRDDYQPVIAGRRWKTWNEESDDNNEPNQPNEPARTAVTVSESVEAVHK